MSNTKDTTRMRLWSAKPGDRVHLDGRWWQHAGLDRETQDVRLRDGKHERTVARSTSYTLVVEVEERERDEWGYAVPEGEPRVARIFGSAPAGGAA